MTRDKRRLLERVNKTTPSVPLAVTQRRCIVLDMDNVLCSMRNSKLLHEAIAGATVGEDLRLDVAKFTALVQRGHAQSICELHAVYANTNPAIASVFQDFGWALSRANTPHGVSRRDLIKRLLRLGIQGYGCGRVPVGTTLVLVSGDGDIIASTQSEGSCSSASLDTLFRASPALRVEIYSWLHALHNKFFDLQRRFPPQVRVHALNDSIAEILTTANGFFGAPLRLQTPGFHFTGNSPSAFHRSASGSTAMSALVSKRAKLSRIGMPPNVPETPSPSSADDALILSVMVAAIAFVAMSVWLYSVVVGRMPAL